MTRTTPSLGRAPLCTGPGEQKARKLEHSDRVAMTTGRNTWADGLDVAHCAFAHAGGGVAYLFRVEPAKAIAFAKNPHAQTTYRFGDG